MASKLAIAYQMKKKSGKKCASGGTVKSGDAEMDYAHGGMIPHGAPVYSKEEDSHRKNMAEGGGVGSKLTGKRYFNEKGINQAMAPEGGESYSNPSKGVPAMAKGMHEKNPQKKQYEEYPKTKHALVMDELKSMSGPTSGKSGFAEGGMVSCPNCTHSFGLTDSGYQDGSHEMDMLSSAMHKRKMAQGGIAEDLGEGAAADEDPNEFDYLVTNKPPTDDTSAGNEIGDEFDANHEDVVARAMLKRKKARG